MVGGGGVKSIAGGSAPRGQSRLGRGLVLQRCGRGAGCTAWNVDEPAHARTRGASRNAAPAGRRSVMTISEETLMAYADGELDAETRASVEAAMREDPEIGKR